MLPNLLNAIIMFMEPSGILPTWAPRIKPHLIRQLYEDDSRGMLDEALLNEVGWGLHARCGSFIDAVEAVNGRAPCPVCGAVVQHHSGQDEVLRCAQCGWQNTWKAYFKTIQHKQLSGAEPVLALFRDYRSRFPLARASQEKMLLIDTLIHGFHTYIRFGNTRAVCVNLIHGSHREIVELLDGLAYGAGSTPGVQEQWQGWHNEVALLAERWRDWSNR